MAGLTENIANRATVKLVSAVLLFYFESDNFIAKVEHLPKLGPLT